MVLTIGILPLGQVDVALLQQIKVGLTNVFPETTCIVIYHKIAIPEMSFDKSRRQYRSNQILATIQGHTTETKANRVLGVTDVDIFIPEFTFVFGEASFPGRAALISLFRLNPQFYGSDSEVELYVQRALKEAVHEIGHTLGLKHCRRYSCVMHFSSSIFDTDKKQSSFCDECYMKAAFAIEGLEKF